MAGRSQDLLIRIIGDSSKGISELEKFAKKADDLTSVGRAGMIMGGLIAAGVGLAVARYAEFDAAMSNVVATGEDAASSQDALRQAALDAGASTVFSATESANAIEELAKAGVSAENTLNGGLGAALDLAAAGGLGVAEAASIMATSMNQFSVDGRNATHVADLLAAGAGKAQGDVTDMSAALAQAGLVANSTGLSIEETTGGLAAFASAGLLGSDAGTSFKSMLQRLTPQSAQAQAEMDRLGISAYDAGGNFIGLADFAGNLQNSLRSLTPEQRQSALATIFGSDAVRAATILYNQGAEGIEEWTDAVNDQGYAAEVARTRLDNLRGDMEGLGGAIDSALITAGSGGNDALRGLVQTATSAVGVFSALPDPVQQGAVYLATAAAAVGLLGGAALIGVPRVVALKAAIAGTSFSIRGLSLAAGGATVGLTAIIALVSAVATAQAEAQAKAQAYTDTLEDGTQRITESTRDMAKEALAAKNSFLWIEQDSAYDAAEKLGISLDLVTDAATGNASALEELQRQIDAGASDFVAGSAAALQYSNSAVDIETAVRGESDSIEQAAEMARQKEQAEKDGAKSTAAAADASKSAAAAYLDASDRVAGLTEELDKLIDSINDANGVGQDAVTSNARYQESLAGIAAEVQSQKDAYEEANGTLQGFTLSLDESTVSGSAAAAMLAGVAGDAQKAAQAQYEVEKKTLGGDAAMKNYSATLATQRQAFVDSAVGAGYNADEVQRLADKVFALPSERQIRVMADTSGARRDIEKLVTTFNGAQITVPVRGSANWNGPGYAGGGEVRGPGTGTSDSILAWLSNGEFVVKEQAARKNKSVLQYINAGGSLPGYAGGGSVSLTAARGSRVPMLALSSSGGSRERTTPLVSSGVDETELALAVAAQSGAAGRGSSERPIYTDTGVLLGWMREVAGQEAQLVWNTGQTQRAQSARMGRQSGV